MSFHVQVFHERFRQQSWTLCSTAVLIRTVVFWFYPVIQFLNISSSVDLNNGLPVCPKRLTVDVGSRNFPASLVHIHAFRNFSVVSHVALTTRHLYPLKLALTSPTSGDRSVGIVRWLTKPRSFYCRSNSLLWFKAEYVPSSICYYNGHFKPIHSYRVWKKQ
jgi:hypothetical protein